MVPAQCVTTAPASTTEPSPLAAASRCALLILLVLLCGCGSRAWNRRSAGSPSLIAGSNRKDPALSGDGRLLASVVSRAGRDTVLLQQQPSGTIVPLRHLQRLQPHSSPSLSWNGRYLAVLVQRGSRSLAVIEDRATGRLHQLPLPGGREPQRLSLAPDGRRLALELVEDGRPRVRVFDLTSLLEADPPAGLPADRPSDGPASP